MEITAKMVQALREKTDLPLMDCKKALVEAGGDEAKAMAILHEKVPNLRNKLVNRETTQGRIAAYVDTAKQRGAIIELRCETAPVANTEDFTKLAALLARHAAAMDNPTPETILQQPLADQPGKTLNDAMNEALNKIRENMKIARTVGLKGHLGAYVHFNGQSGTLVEMNADCPEELKKDVCMHVTAMKPAYLKREDVPKEMVEKERQTLTMQVKEDPKMAGKPPQIIEGAVTGKLGRWYSEFVLLDQPFVKEDKHSVGQVLKNASPTLTVNRYVRLEVGVL